MLRIAYRWILVLGYLGTQEGCVFSKEDGELVSILRVHFVHDRNDNIVNHVEKHILEQKNSRITFQMKKHTCKPSLSIYLDIFWEEQCGKVRSSPNNDD